jgi:predicted ester cyclase
MAEAEEIARRWFKAIEDHDLDGAIQMLDPDVDFSSPPAQFKGLEPARSFLRGYVDGFPDARFNLSNVVASGDRAIAEGTYSGTNTGPLQTPGGEVPPTGKSIALPFAQAILIRDGRIAEQHVYFDQLAFLGQLGLVPEGAPGS